jgi:hypothetical protein
MSGNKLSFKDKMLKPLNLTENGEKMNDAEKLWEEQMNEEKDSLNTLFSDAIKCCKENKHLNDKQDDINVILRVMVMIQAERNHNRLISSLNLFESYDAFI